VRLAPVFPLPLLTAMGLVAMAVTAWAGGMAPGAATLTRGELFPTPVTADSATATGTGTGTDAGSRPVITADAPVVPAAAYIVVDGDTGQMLANAEGSRRRPIGSLVKLMTARLVLAAGEPDRPVAMPDVHVGADESQLGLVPGEVLSRGDLFDAMLVASANDAARALAVDVGGDEASFVAMMNDEAAALGLDDTRYANPVGLDAAGQWSSAEDVARLATTLMDDPKFRSSVAATEVSVGGHHETSTNDLFGVYRGVDGIKTGHTGDAGWCIAASATRDGRQVVVVVLGSPTEHGRDAAAITLLDWAFSATHPAREG
jgi:D-alanyl-D-alanine carboxypeptidase (penicillin-binding protein 5/6)